MPKEKINDKAWVTDSIYTLSKKTVGECVKACALKEGAWYMPDIQRSFVWNANQTLLFIDSLFRGWPFGVLTLEVACRDDCGTIPPRAFIQVNDCQKESFQRKVFEREDGLLPKEFYLVLDGQQRLQSLMLAFGSEGTKFIQDEESWYWQLCQDRPRKAYGIDFEMVSAMLALDFESCFRAYQEAEERISEIKFSESGAICFTFLDNKGASTYQDDPILPFPVQRLSRVHLRLSKLWKLFDRMKGDNDFDLEVEWQAWDLDREWIGDSYHQEFVRKLVTYLYRKAYKQEVSYIELKCPDGLDHEVFQKRVVEIFTRLNKAGTPLTINEVTSAWLKNSWKGKQSLDEVVSEFGNLFSWRHLEIPDFIRFVSALWTIEDQSSEDRKVIQNKDLTNSLLLGKLATWFSKRFKGILEDVAAVCKELESIGWMWNEIGPRAFTLAVVLAYRRQVRENRPRVNEQEKVKYDRKIGEANLTRFLAISHWSGYWSADTINTWAAKWALAVNDKRNLCKFNEEFLALQVRLSESAREAFGATRATRNTVRKYYLFLQVWHRLNRARFKSWGVHMSHGALDVDHCYAFARWEALLGKLAGQMTVDELSEIDPVVNDLGNCMLLERSKNIAKGKKAMIQFFQEISDSEQKALLLTPNMIVDDEQQLSLQLLKEEIEKRGKCMRREVIQFINGEIECV